MAEKTLATFLLLCFIIRLYYQGHWNACHKKWSFTDNELCDCGEIQTMSHIVNFCPLSWSNLMAVYYFDKLLENPHCVGGTDR